MTGPLVIAHRTCPLDAPENSLVGIALARAAGADVVEIDVRLTSDGRAVCVHDRVPRRTVGSRRAVDRTSYDGLVRAAARANHEPPLLLVDALAAAGDGPAVAVDVKAPAAMAATIEALHTIDPRTVMVWCREASALTEVHEALPGVPTALLRNTRSWWRTRRYLDDAAAARADAVSLHQRAVSPRAVRYAHDLGLVAYAWVLDEAAHRRVLACGVDGVVTDWPRQARRLVSGPAAL